MIASIIIVILALLFGGLSIFVQFIKDGKRRRRVEDIASIPAAFAFLGTIAWLMTRYHRLDGLGVSPLALWLALTFFLVIPSGTYIFSPAYRDAARFTRRPR
jgi:hypothetical protein